MIRWIYQNPISSTNRDNIKKSRCTERRKKYNSWKDELKKGFKIKNILIICCIAYDYDL
jgi:hypothetical protein